MTEYSGSGAPGADRPAYQPPPDAAPGQPLPSAPPVPADYGYGQYGQQVPAGMYYDQSSELVLPNGTELASHGRRIGAFFLTIPLFIVTLGIGYLIWGLIAWGHGQTPTMQVLKMRVYRPAERRPATWGIMALREIVGGIANGILSIVTELISFVMFLTSKDRKPFQDHIASTVVLYDPNKVLPM